MKTRKILGAMLTLAFVVAIQGCQSLTMRMWSPEPMHSSLISTDSVTCYVNDTKLDEYYMALTTGDGIKIFKIKSTFAFALKPRLPRSAEFILSDFSKVPKEQRIIMDYEFLIFKETTTMVPDFSGRVLGTPCKTKVTPVPSIPSGFKADCSIIKTVTITKWVPTRKTGVAGYACKGIATPLTAVADLFVVPICCVCRVIWWMHFGSNFRS